jgi:hypothetical protein
MREATSIAHCLRKASDKYQFGVRTAILRISQGYLNNLQLFKKNFVDHRNNHISRFKVGI